MESYDIIVVGAGPAGSSAALAASRQGARTLLLEEHPAVGTPRHCTGRIHGTTFSRAILAGMSRHVVITECRSRRYFSPGGNLILESPLPPESVYLIVREEFDRALARQAVAAGVELLLNTRVTGLLREKDRICGVTTDSEHLPAAYGRCVIVAQGAKGRRSGIARQEELSDPDERFHTGLMLELTGVHGVEPGILETFFGAMAERGYLCLWPHERKSCLMTGNRTLADLEALKRGGSPIGQRLKDATPVAIHAHILGSQGGMMLPALVKDGLILAGDSAGFNGFMHAVVSGRCAGEVAAEALRQGDVGEARLKRYEALCREIGLQLTIGSWDKLMRLKGLSDKEIESVLPGMLDANEVEYRDILPF